MLNQTLLLLLAMIVFVGSHFLLSHLLRARAVALLGESWFRLLYSLIAIVCLALARLAYQYAPQQALFWSGGNATVQIIYAVLTYVAIVLFLGSILGNPALVGANLTMLHERQPEGVLRITRHPMMFSFALWALAEIVLMPSVRKLVFCGGLLVLSLAGAALQDRKKAAMIGPAWQTWCSRTRFWPDLRQAGAAGILWLAALIPWLVLTWLHARLGENPVGIWLFVPGVTD